MLETDRTLIVDPLNRLAGADGGAGVRRFDTIDAAAARARPGDTVRIAPGVYRERVTPRRGGEAGRPVRYVADGPGVVVRGSVMWTPGWQRLDDGPAWVADVDPDLFPGQNLAAAGLATMPGHSRTQLFIADQPMLEVLSRAALAAAPGSWMTLDGGSRIAVHPPGGASGGDLDDVQLTVRDRLLAPDERGLGHIHVEGITFEHCGNQFPAGFWKRPGEGGHPQAGAVGCRGGHAWLIRGCTIRHAKSIGLDCGNEGGFDLQTGEPIPQTQRFPDVGGHRIIDNDICDNGVCGLAAAGSSATHIRHNRVERNNTLGCQAYETAGIKVHFFYDGVIEHNLVRDNECSGIWLDNRWYGSRVTGNAVLNNMTRAIFIEMGEGPCELSHNTVAFTRAGDGIYCHDSSGVDIHHNLLYANTHAGVSCRHITQRRALDHEGESQRVACRDISIYQNVFIDNYRAAIILPVEDGERVRHLTSNHNLFISGAQSHWIGQPRHTFALELSQRPEDAPPLPEGVPTGQTTLSPEQWQRLGRDLDSRWLAAGSDEPEDGLISHAWAGFSSRNATLWLRSARAWAQTRLPADADGPPGPFGSDLLQTDARSGCLLPLLTRGEGSAAATAAPVAE